MQQKITFPNLPLAIYREIAAHLNQVEGVVTGLEAASLSESFDYQKSQISYLWIESPTNFSVVQRKEIEQILNYYSDRHFISWQILTDEP